MPRIPSHVLLSNLSDVRADLKRAAEHPLLPVDVRTALTRLSVLLNLIVVDVENLKGNRDGES